MAQVVVIQDAAELRNQESSVARARAHGQLVTIERGDAQGHSREAPVLANRRRGLHVEFIQRHHAIEPPLPRHPRNGVENLLARQVLRHQRHVFKALARPVAVFMLVDGKKRGPDSHVGTLAHEILALLVGSDTENPVDFFGHRAPVLSCQYRLARIALPGPANVDSSTIDSSIRTR
jgi:hypothetical protein